MVYRPTRNITTSRKHKKRSLDIFRRRRLSQSEPKHMRCATTIPTTPKNLSSKIWNNEFTSRQRFTYHNSQPPVVHTPTSSSVHSVSNKGLFTSGVCPICISVRSRSFWKMRPKWLVAHVTKKKKCLVRSQQNNNMVMIILTTQRTSTYDEILKCVSE